MGQIAFILHDLLQLYVEFKEGTISSSTTYDISKRVVLIPSVLKY